jgi:cytochrome c-type biogenesis protein CcmH/NrfG
MARADRRRSVREARRVQRRPRAHAGGARIAEDTMFFPKLRAHAKWVFVMLAVVFMFSFVLLGVGSGSGGVADVLSNLFHGSSGTSVSSQIKKDQKKIDAHPRDTATYLDLATLYQQKQDQAAAIATLESALKVKPKDLDVLSRIASIYQSQAETARNNAADAQTALAAANTAPPGVDVSSSLGQAFTADPLSQELKTRATDAFSKVSPAFTKAEDGYRRLAIAARGTSEEANAQLQLASIAKDTLQVTGQPSHALVALAAYKRYLKLEPKGVQATLAKQTITQLQAFLPKKKQ